MIIYARVVVMLVGLQVPDDQLPQVEAAVERVLRVHLPADLPAGFADPSDFDVMDVEIDKVARERDE